AIGKADPISAYAGAREFTAPPAFEAAHLEEVGEIGAEEEIQRNLNGRARVVAHHHLVEQRIPGDHPVPLDLDRVDWKLEILSVQPEVGIAQVDAQLRVLAAYV